MSEINYTHTPTFAFIVGINDYEHVQKLNTPLNDISALSKILGEEYSFEVHLCSNPTKIELEKAMKDFLQKVVENHLGAEAKVLIYFACHGIAINSEEGLKGYLLPKDTVKEDVNTWFPMEDLLAYCNNLPFKHQLIILDCCFSGAFRKASNFRALLIDDDIPFSQQHYRYYTQNHSQQVLTSTSHTQKALDSLGYREEKEGFSPFAATLISCLEGLADSNKDKVLTLAEVYNHLQQKVTALTFGANHDQNVGLFPLDKHKNGEFLFIPKSFKPEELTELQYKNPYKGLRAYEPRDRQLFFGREKAIKELVEKMQHTKMLVVIGASGTGKSSLVKAGLVPRLRDKNLNVPDSIRPGKNPLANLPHATTFDVLVIDQFEEIITQADEREVRPFLDKIKSYIEEYKKQIIITLRIDFETQVVKESLEPYWTEGRYMVPLFSVEELREIIITPAARVGRFIEPMELVDDIIGEVINYPGSLPLLSFTMSELFQKCEKDLYKSINRTDYVTIGGVTGGLQKTADRLYEIDEDKEGENKMREEAEKQTLKNILLRMVSLSGGETAGKRVYLEELIFEEEAENKRVAKLQKQLTAARLVRADENDEGKKYIEPAHDALVRTWKRLQEWIKEVEQENILLHAKLIAAVADYQNKKEHKDFLWDRSPNLSQVTEAQKTQHLHLNRLENEFVRKSIKAKKRTQNIRYALITAAFIIISGLGVFSFFKANEATKNAEEAQKNENIAKENEAKAEQRLKDFLAEKAKSDSLEAQRLFKNAESYLKSGDLAVAYNTLKKADTLNPNNPKIIQKLKSLIPTL